jgi:2-polyprenyl-3-methyl-5-hydroxy-6-metoxy-1,4-benzoquinol methylase
MTSATIKKLNQLNQAFYDQVSSEFDHTRQQPWLGWAELHQKTPAQIKQVVDLGCGNARLALYLANQGLETYFGFDANAQLLQKAKAKLKTTQVDYHLFHFDLINILEQSILVEALTAALTTHHQHPTLIALFGVLHHIPSQTLRQMLFNDLAAFMNPNDRLVISCWQFDQAPSLWQRKVAPSVVGLTESELETNDFILDWQRGQAAYRDCQLTSSNEGQQLAQGAQLTLVDHWQADGKPSNLNHYYLLTKKA